MEDLVGDFRKIDDTVFHGHSKKANEVLKYLKQYVEGMGLEHTVLVQECEERIAKMATKKNVLEQKVIKLTNKMIQEGKALKVAHEKQVVGLREPLRKKHEKQLDDVKQQYHKELNDMKQQYQKELDAVKQRYQKELDDANQQLDTVNQQLDDTKKERDDAKKELESTKKQIKYNEMGLQKAIRLAEEKVKAECEQKLRELQTMYSKEIETVFIETEKVMAEQKANFQSDQKKQLDGAKMELDNAKRTIKDLTESAKETAATLQQVCAAYKKLAEKNKNTEAKLQQYEKTSAPSK